MVAGEPVRIRGSLLVVCTANVCRSPLAARLLAVALPTADVSSAGVRAMVRAPMCEVSAAVLPGGDVVEHEARQLTPEMVIASDIVITMEREHRSAAVRLAPGSQAKVFTLREAAALTEGLVDREAGRPNDLRAFAAALHGMRGLVQVQAAEPAKRRWWSRPAEPGDPLTIADGHGLDLATHRAAAQQVAGSADDLLRRLRALRRSEDAAPADPA